MLFKGYRYIYHYNIGSSYLPYPPLLLWVEPTNRCNLRCTMCPNSLSDKSRLHGNMELDLFEKIVRESKGWVDLYYLFLAGESLLHKQLPDMIRIAADNKIKIVLHTNGCLMTRALAEALIDAGLHEISFSFDAIDPNEYEKYRAGANYEKTLSNIIRFLEVKQQRKSKTPNVTIQCIDFKASISQEEKKRFRNLFKGLPVNNVNVIPAHSWAGTFKDDKDLRVPGKSDDYFACKFLWCSLAIAWNGDVVACCNDLFGEVRLGNIREQTMQEVWNGKEMQRFRQAVVAGQFSEYPVCNDCEVPYNHNNARKLVRLARTLPNPRLAGTMSLAVELARRAVAAVKYSVKK